MKLFEPLRDVQYSNIIKYGFIYTVIILVLTFTGRIGYFFFDNYIPHWEKHGYLSMQSRIESDLTDMNKWFIRRLFFPTYLRYFVVLTTGVLGFMIATIQYCFLRHKKEKVLDIQ